MSAIHQVKRLDRTSKEFAPSKPVQQKKQVFFVRCGSSRRSAISPGPQPGTKSGPDVFADALVPRNAFASVARASSSWRFDPPEFISDRARCDHHPVRPAIFVRALRGYILEAVNSRSSIAFSSEVDA